MNSRKKCILYTVSVLSLLMVSTLSWGICIAPITTVSFPSVINVQRDATVGTVLATVQTTTQITCDTTGADTVLDGSWYIYTSATNTDYGSSAVADHRKTALNGVGFLWSNLNSYTGTPQIMTSIAINDSVRNLRGVRFNGVTTFTDTWSLVKTSAMTSGTLNLSSIIMNQKTPVTGLDKGSFFAYAFTPVVINVLACSITTSSINVALEPIIVSKFTGAGVTLGDKAFTIGLNCDAGTRINASLSGMQNAETSDNSVLALSNAGSSGIASGVGIQLLYGNTPLKLGQNIVLKTSSGGSEFPSGAFTARYYQTKATATVGDANTTATLNLTYQ